jgi:hypothetical protein
MNLLSAARVHTRVLAALALGGCASTMYEGKYQWGEGWRIAHVLKVQRAADMQRPGFFT